MSRLHPLKCQYLRFLPAQLLRSDEFAEYSAMDASADGHTAFLADKDGSVEVVDTRQAHDAKPAEVRGRRLIWLPQYLHFPGGQLLPVLPPHLQGVCQRMEVQLLARRSCVPRQRGRGTQHSCLACTS